VRYGGDDLGDLFGEGTSFSDFFTSIFGGTGGGRRQGGINFQTRPQQGQHLEQEVEISLTEAYHGTTRVLNKNGRRLEVKIPSGARTGTKVRMRGEGNQGSSGGLAGDLYLKVKVASDPRFEHKEDDLYVSVPVDLYTAVLGGEIRVPTLAGDVNLKIPAGAQNGRTFRLRGKGMPRLRKSNEHGDLYARLDVRLPGELSSKQRELFEQLRDLEK
jgi:curved DNA-binding protein